MIGSGKLKTEGREALGPQPAKASIFRQESRAFAARRLRPGNAPPRGKTGRSAHNPKKLLHLQ